MKLLDCGLKTDGAFITCGFRSWGKALERFSKHEQSVTHQAAVTRMQTAAEPSPTAMMAATGKAKEVAEAREALHYIFGAITYLAGQGLPIRRREEETGNLQRLLDEFEVNSPALKRWRKRKQSFTSPEIQNEILELLASTVVRQIARDVHHQGVFAVMADETRDCAGTEQVAICLRSVTTDLQVEEQFIGLYSVESTTALVLSTVIKDALLRLGLDLSYLRGQCYDGAANMSGRFKGTTTCMHAVFVLLCAAGFKPLNSAF